MKNIFITGGAGFIGCSLSNKLAAIGFNIVVYDNLHPQVHKEKKRPNELANGVELVIGDMCEPALLSEAITRCKPDIVIHLAAETGTGQSIDEAPRHTNVNVNGTAYLLDVLAKEKCSPEKIILASSRAVYGEGVWRNRVTNELFYPRQRTNTQLKNGRWNFENADYTPSCVKNMPMPISIYGATKISQEYLISTWASAFDVDYTILRFQNVYGPGQSLINSYTGMVPLFARLAKSGEAIPLYEDGQMLRDYIYIEDASNAIIAAMRMNQADHKIFDVGTGKSRTVRAVAEWLAERYSAPMPYVCGRFSHGDVRHASCDVSEIQNFLKWNADVSLEEGLSKLCDWLDGQI